ncbi:PucR family transcriptional regulator [Actinomadura oligospora]|uniref:PucR family transcriptional regulator n=1 Tax=Actinomadura oligospora TaxID=111804 RepID=UPI00047DE48E|nr:helix-turn-helix domain-containing protein [Actinomadura oligospora]
MSAPPAPVLGRILADLGSTLVEVAAGDPDPARPVAGVLIHDPHDEPARLPGAVVLGVGVHGPGPVAELVARAADLDAAAIIVRSPVAVDAAVRDAAARTGVAVLGLTPGASWAQVAAMLRSLLAVDEIGVDDPGPSDDHDGPPATDLFALANAIAALLDGPATVEDRSGRVLAFSSRQDEGDQARIATILDRQVPADKLRALEERGAFHALYRSDRPVYVEGIAEKPRVAIAVRAGGEILGSIWVVVDRPLTPDRERSLAEAARVVALHLLRRRAGQDVERRLRADLLATVLEGGANASEAAARLGLTAQPACVLALAVTGESPAADRVAAGERVSDALALHLAAIHPRTATASLGGVTYAILPTATDEPALRVADAFLTRVGARVPAVIGIGRVAARPAHLPRSRHDADRALRVLRQGRARARAARLTDVHVASLMADLADRMADEDDVPDGPVVRLRAYDAEHHTALTGTLAAWLDTFGDVPAAAAAVHVHPNTFRYRLKRLTEVSGLDLTDADARFEAMLQLRLTPPSP